MGRIRSSWQAILLNVTLICLVSFGMLASAGSLYIVFLGTRSRQNTPLGMHFWTISADVLIALSCVALLALRRAISAEHPQTKALRKSEEFLDRTGRIAGVGGWEVDLITSEVTWSAETARIHGAAIDYKPTLKEGLAFYTPASRTIIKAAVETACVSGVGWDLELSITRVDGQERWVRTLGTAEIHEGKAIRLSGAFQDITARIAARKALKDAHERVAIATDSGRIGIWDWDLVKGVVDCDAWMHRLHGIEPTGLPANQDRWREQLHPEDRETTVQAMYDAIEGIRPYDTEFRIIWPDGSVHNIRATGQVARDEQGRALRMIGANWDVTDARRLTLELAQHHELLRVTLASIADGVITTDAQCNVLWMNPVAERMIGWASEEALALPLTRIFNIVNADTRLPVENPVVTCLQLGQSMKLSPNTILIARDGTEYGIEDSAAPIRGDKGEVLGGVLIFHDVSEQRRLAAESSRITSLELKFKDDFLSHVSHELRSPLTSIYSFSSIIADGLAGETTPEQQEYLHIILKNVAQLRSMIEDLLTVTQAREGKLSIDLQRVSPSEAIIDAIHTLQGMATQKLISLDFECAADCRPAWADPIRLRQVLIILLDNAVKFTPPGGKVSVRLVETDSRSLLIQISDTGCGIAPDKRSLVFDKLYQIAGKDQPDTIGTGRNGLGLGLHIAKDLVTRQGGYIWTNSASENGSIFSFTLPVFAEELLIDNPQIVDVDTTEASIATL